MKDESTIKLPESVDEQGRREVTMCRHVDQNCPKLAREENTGLYILTDDFGAPNRHTRKDLEALRDNIDFALAQLG